MRSVLSFSNLPLCVGTPGLLTVREHDIDKNSFRTAQHHHSLKVVVLANGEQSLCATNDHPTKTKAKC